MGDTLQVAVIGAGSWGTTVAHLASRNQPTTLWARRSEIADEINSDHTNTRYLGESQLRRQLVATDDLVEAVSNCDVLVMGVPTAHFRSVLSEAAPHVRPWVPVLSLSKGFETGTLKRMTEIIHEELPGHPAGVITGPNIAKEIMGGQAAAAVIGMRHAVVAQALQQVFTTAMFRVYTNTDVIGCEVGGALKNVIAIATGMAEGLDVGDNTRAMVLTRGLAELSRLGVAMGGQAETFAGLAGMGDLVATCMSPYSRNRTVGERLGRGETVEQIQADMNMVAEGIKTARLVMELGAAHDLELPICQEIHDVIHHGNTPTEAYRGLMKVRPGTESDAG